MTDDQIPEPLRRFLPRVVRKGQWAVFEIDQGSDQMALFGPTCCLRIGAVGAEQLEPVLGQVDTGSATCGLSVGSAERLKLRRIDVVRVAAGDVAESDLRGLYEVGVEIGGIRFRATAVELHAIHDPHDFLIGRDMLAGAVLNLHFGRGAWALGIPVR